MVHVIGMLLMACAFVGCVVPMVPGPVLGLLAVLLLYFTATPPAVLVVTGLAVIVVAATVVDYLIPVFGARQFNCSRTGMIGCALGTVIGLFFLPIGLVMGPVWGTFLGELFAGKNVDEAVEGGIGSFVGTVAATYVKVMSCVFACVAYLWTVF